MSETSSNITAGPVPLGCASYQAPAVSWPWLAALRARKVAPYLTFADTLLDFSRDAGWNIQTLTCKRKIACSPSPSFTLQPDPAHSVECIPSLDSLPARSLDVIVCHHTLGLLPDPHQVLLTFKSLLKPRGRLLLFVPLETERSVRALAGEDSSPWLYTWNVQSLGNLLGEAGFQLVEGKILRYSSESFALRAAFFLDARERTFHLARALGSFLQPCREILALATPFAD